MIYEKYSEIPDFINILDEISKWVNREFTRRFPSNRIDVSTTTVKMMQDGRVISIPLTLHQYDYRITKEDAQQLDLFYIRDLFMNIALKQLRDRVNEFTKALREGGFTFNLHKDESSFMDWFIRMLDISLIHNNSDFTNLVWSNNIYPILSKHLQDREDRMKLNRWYIQRYCNIRRHE